MEGGPLKRRRVSNVFEENLEHMPASKFFWYDRITADKKPQYLQLLGKLMLLYTAPHFYYSGNTYSDNGQEFRESLYPVTECSFFKKFEHFTKSANWRTWYLKQLVKILGFQNQKYIFSVAEDLEVQMDAELAFSMSGPSLFSVLENWLKPKGLHVDKPLLIAHLMIDNITDSSNHSTLLVAKRASGRINFFFMNPWGTGRYRGDAMLRTEIKRAIQIVADVQLPLKHEVHELPVPCPVLQTDEQGGTCFQWMAMIFALVSLSPRLLDDEARLTKLLSDLSAHANFNILLFTMSMFLRSLPLGSRSHLRNIAYTDFDKAKEKRKSYAELRRQCLQEDMRYRQALYRTLGKVNCDMYNIKSRGAPLPSPDMCQSPCRRCGHRCAPEALVRDTAQGLGGCNPLDMHEILQDMVDTFLELRTLVGNMDFDKQQIYRQKFQEQLDHLPRPSLELYQSQLLSDEDFAAFLGASHK